MGEHNLTTSSSSTNSSSSPTAQQPAYTADYLAQLLKDKKQLAAFPNVFSHLERLVDEGKVSKVCWLRQLCTFSNRLYHILFRFYKLSTKAVMVCFIYMSRPTLLNM